MKKNFGQNAHGRVFGTNSDFDGRMSVLYIYKLVKLLQESENGCLPMYHLCRFWCTALQFTQLLSIWDVRKSL